MIPNKPLNFRVSELDLDAIIWLQQFGAGAELTADDLRELKRIIAMSSDWTEEEVGRVKVSELAEVMSLLARAIVAEREGAIPFGSESASPPGRGEQPTASPPG